MPAIPPDEVEIFASGCKIIGQNPNQETMSMAAIPCVGIQRPEDMESTLLNFTFLVLLIINYGGYYFFWRK